MADPMETPPRRRRSTKPVNSPMLDQSMVLLAENDDRLEKKARRKSQLLSNNILSPGGVSASPGRQTNAEQDKRRSTNLSHAGMSNEQLKAHYASCIKLSSENKINVKNAFALHLIDYMKDLLKESQNVDTGTNFQLASCTLDAGVKIYSYRVDVVHKDTYKVLGSLGRAVDNQDDEDGEGSQGSQDGSQKVKKVKKSSGKTIEKNLKNINCEKFDVDFEIDPYFHKTSNAYDEGGTAGLLSLQLKTNTDETQLVLDSSSKVTFDKTPAAFTGEMSNLQFLSQSYSKVDLEVLEMCPALSTFLFRGWDKDSDHAGLLDDSFDDNVHRFDINAPVIQEPSDVFGDNDSIGGGGYDDYSDTEQPADQDLGPVEFDGREAQFATPRSAGHLSILNCTGASTLPLMFPLEVSEYSFFNQTLLSMWKGPLHWKVIARSKDKTLAGSLAATTTKKGKSGKKDAFLVDFDNDDLNFKKMISSGRAETYLKDSSLKRYTVKMTTLPLELTYEMKFLFVLFMNDKLVLKRKSDVPSSTLDKDEVNYDYDNKNDREGFCADVGDGGNYDDYDDDVGGGPEGTFDMGDGEDGGAIEKHGFGGESLIAPPAKVQILDINYAKSAKRIDIKKLKTAMWNVLTESERNKENIDGNARPVPNVAGLGSDDTHDKSCVSGAYSFKSMYEILPSKVTASMAKNLSGPISFVCLLYLANEKNLKLTGNETMDDICIVSDVTPTAES